MTCSVVMVALKMSGDSGILKSIFVDDDRVPLLYYSAARKICCIAVFNVFRNL